jgi:hypothetical protein
MNSTEFIKFDLPGVDDGAFDSILYRLQIGQEQVELIGDKAGNGVLMRKLFPLLSVSSTRALHKSCSMLLARLYW